jgi:hypothetical protein
MLIYKMEQITRLSIDIKSLLSRNINLLSPSQDIVTNKVLECREDLICKLTAISKDLAEVMDIVGSNLAEARAAQNHDTELMGKVMTRISNEWTTITRKKKTQTHPKIAIKKPRDRGKDDFFTKVPITDALFLRAIYVTAFDKVKQDGNLYYVEPANHFAIMLNGQLFHGNIGNIYSDEKNPEKIKECKYTTTCSKYDKCRYYHDPISFPGSKDSRNYVASSWVYYPPHPYCKNRPRGRRIGSRNNMDMDIIGLQPDEIGRLRDQAMHDLLCSLLIHQTYHS